MTAISYEREGPFAIGESESASTCASVRSP